MVLFDFHIHTRYSSCCKETYSYPEVWAQIQQLGLDGFGISDHAQYSKAQNLFLQHHRKDQEDLLLKNRGLVGLEISIFNRKGDLKIDRAILQAIDYKIISEHVHVAKIFSGFFTFIDRIQKLKKNWPQNESKINHQMKKLLELQLAGIQRNPRSIFGHIFHFPLHHGFSFPILYEMRDTIISALERHNVALELHSHFLQQFYAPKPEAIENSPWLFYQDLAHVLKKTKLSFSLGSDAHKLQNLISAPKWRKFLVDLGIQESRLITPSFFDHSQ